MNPIMTVYGAISALSCVPIALMTLLANTKSDGNATINNAHWVTAKGGAHVRYATVRELWQHNNPGKTWEDYQRSQRRGCLITMAPVALVIVFVAIKILGSGEWIKASQEGHGPIWVGYVVLLSVILMVVEIAVAYLQYDTWNKFSVWPGNSYRQSTPLVIVELINVAVAGLSLLYMLLFGVLCGFRGLGKQAPDSGLFRFFGKTFLWVCAIVWGVFLIDVLMTGIIRWRSKTESKREATAKAKKEKKRKEVEDKAKEAVPKFVMQLAQDPDLRCPICDYRFRSSCERAVVLIGGTMPICEKCYTVPIGRSYNEDDVVMIDFAKVSELADTIRKQMRK